MLSIRRYREQLSYLLFGVLTTAVNYGVFWLLELLWNGRYVLTANLIAFAAATLFAYLTNKVFVFQARYWKPGVMLREVSVFVSARLFSFALEEFGLYLAAYTLRLGRFRIGPVDGVMAAKILLSVVAVILNYIFSKLLVFRSAKEKEVSRVARSSDSSCIQ